MNYLDNQLIVLRDEIDDLFSKIFGKKSNDAFYVRIKSQLLNVGEKLRDWEKEDNVNFKYLALYLYYLQYHFLNLLISFLKVKKENTDIYQQLCRKKDIKPFDYFMEFGFFCFISMTNEIQKTIFVEKRYDLFWDQLYHFWNNWELEENEIKKEEIKNMIFDFKDNDIFLYSFISTFLLRGQKGIKSKGRPAKVTFEILANFADMLAERNRNKKSTLETLLKKAIDGKMDWTAPRNWLRSHMTLLKSHKKSIEELTKDDIIFMWKKYQKLKKK